MTSYLQVDKVTKQFDGEHVLTDVSVELARQSTMAVLGRSGSGKTTLLKIIAGLETQDTGRVSVEGNSLDNIAPEKRNAVYIYQEPLLFPHLNVYENVAFGLRLRKVARDELHERTSRWLNDLGLKDHQHKMPSEISGGQKQRVAFGRALVIRPSLLLLDEPFGALDPDTRRSMQDLFIDVVKRRQMTCLFVTHDLREALVVGDAFAHLHHGEMTVFDDRDAFLSDDKVGAADEITFWRGMGT